MDVASATVVGDAMVEVTLNETRASDGWILDGRGRLQIHRGILRGAGIPPGARLAVVRLEQPPRAVLTDLTSLAVRRMRR
jgi:hypothetical protein